MNNAQNVNAQTMRYIRTFTEICKEDVELVGGKAAMLGELTKAGFINVPQGFSVTDDALAYHIKDNNLDSVIDDLAASINYDDYADTEEKTNKIRTLIASVTIPQDLHLEISGAVAEIEKYGEPFVAVRSSVSIKDSKISSFPGMMDTFHYLKGEKEIIEHIRLCWASLWTSRATFTRHRQNIDHKKAVIAPIVQNMVHSETAGVMFTAHPISGDRNEIVIEANWGLGESVVSGKSMNDFFVIDKSTLQEKTRRISEKTFMVCFDEEKGIGRKECEVPPHLMKATTISADQVRELGETGLRIEKHFGFPQDIEWAYANGQLYILQSRNVKTIKM